MFLLFGILEHESNEHYRHPAENETAHVNGMRRFDERKTLVVGVSGSVEAMNKADLTEILAVRAGIPKVRAASYIEVLTETIRESLVRGEKVTISDFGTFNVSQRRSFSGYNPKDGGPMNVPARTIPVFRAGKGLKASLNAG